jgi:hypothetical protein
MQQFHLIRTRLEEGAPPSEIDLLLEAARDRLRRLAETIDATKSKSVTQMLKHLAFIGYYHRREQPDSYAPDIEDINVRDLPGIIEEVAKWETRLLSPGLVEAVAHSWEDRNYVNVVRDAFVYLEQALRGAGKVPSTDSVTAGPLVNRLLSPGSPSRIQLPGDSRSGGELQGVHQLFAGAFQVFRNPAAHRPVEYELGTTNEILGLVDLCLRILGTEEAPSLHVQLADGTDVDSAVATLEEVAGRNPGTSLVRVQIGGRLPDEEPTTLSGRVTDSDALRAELVSLPGVLSVTNREG